MIDQIQIIAFPRLHLTLIGMHSSGYRINGGIGFAINNPKVELRVTGNPTFSYSDLREAPFETGEVQRIHKVINDTCQEFKFKRNIAVSVQGGVPTHVGFGTSTMIRLACLEGLFLLNGLEVSNTTLIKLSGRGRTSGIGVRTYFEGGYVLDIGHKSEDLALSPSSKREEISSESMLILSDRMPKWNFGICIPKTIKRKTEEEESQFFQQNCPVKDSSVYETLYHSLYGVIASFKANDIEVFNEACKKIQECEWKYKERSLYGEELLKYESTLKDFGADSVGMSSLGPTLFFTANDIGNVRKKMIDKFDSDVKIIEAQPTNEGRRLNFE